MGLTIPFLVYYLFVLLIGVAAFFKTYKLWIGKKIKFKDLIFGLIIALSLYGVILLTSTKEDSILVLLFKVPIGMLFVPYLFYHIVDMFRADLYILKLSLISMSFTVSGIILYACISMFIF